VRAETIHADGLSDAVTLIAKRLLGEHHAVTVIVQRRPDAFRKWTPPDAERVWAPECEPREP
jgi:hypothetical protein